MSTLQEIESAIRQLSREERAELRNWFDSSELIQDASERQRELSRSLHEATKIAAAAQKLLSLYSATQPENSASTNDQNPKSDDSRLSALDQLPAPVVQFSKYRNSQEWLRAFQAWVDSHSDVTAVADDSRESIYAGRGE